MTLILRRRNLFVVFMAMLLVVMPLLFSQPVLSQLTPLPAPLPARVSSTPEPDNSLDGIPVMLDDQLLFLVYEGVGSFSTRERADAIMRRIETVAADPSIPVDVTVEDQSDSSNVVMGKRVLVTVRDVDARELGVDRKALAQDFREQIQKGIQKYRSDRQPQIIFRGVGISLIATFLLVVIVRLLNQLSPRHIREDRHITERMRAIRLFGVELVPASNVTHVLIDISRFSHIILLLAVIVIYLSVVLSQFVWTRELGGTLWSYLAATLRTAITAIAAYIPNLLSIALIILVTSYTLKFVKYFFNRVRAGAIGIPGFYSDWAEPTNRLVTILILGLALMIIVPYLPGYGSPAFQGVSIFFGVLFSLGATGTITNVIAGLVLIYARSFQLGDRIRVVDITGDVVEKTLLVTRIRTIKNELVTLPNSLILSNYITNYTRLIRTGEGALILHTSITLGYDVPWRGVEAVLVKAALTTKYILETPQPFVLQTSLNDYHITYQLNAYTNHPEMMAQIYSRLHQNVQDRCNEAGIEILSPGYTALRDGNHSTIPASYLPDGYIPPTFGVANNTHRNSHS